jgi:hypothetical protein
MGFAFNPFTGNFDLKGSGGGGGSSYIDGEVATYADLPLDGSAALNSAWLVRTASGVWPVTRKQAGIYIRTATGGSNRDSDYTYAGTMPDVFSDAQFLIYDDGNTTRSMQIEVTDNETLTFKVTGTDSVVRSVAFALSAIVLAALMASSAFAQNVGLVTDTNGNVVTRRTNELVWSNNLRFSPLTNANSRTAIIGTNGALTAGNPPSGAAASNSILRADGAGGSTFVAEGVYLARQLTNSASTTNAETASDLSLSNVPAGLYWVSGQMQSSATTGREYRFKASSQVFSPRNMLFWFSTGGASSAFGTATNFQNNTDGSSGTRDASITGPLLLTNSSTITFNISSGGTNQVLSNSFIYLRKLD